MNRTGQPNATVPAEPARGAGRIAGRVAFALAPWVTLGYGAPIAFLVAAVRYQRRGKAPAVILWISTVIYIVAVVVEVVTSDATPSTTADNVFTVCALTSMVVAGVEAVTLAIVAGRYPPPARVSRRATTRSPSDISGAKPPYRLHARTSSPSQSESRPVGIGVGVLFLAIGGALAAQGISDRQASVSLNQRGLPAAATVVKVEIRGGCNDGCVDQPYVTVAFTDANGVARQATHAGRESTRVGDKLQIVYDPRDPSKVRWEGDVDGTIVELGLGAVSIASGLVLVLIGFARVRRRRRAASAPDNSAPDNSGPDQR